MHIESTPIPGCTVISLTPHADHRGFFARAWCRKESEESGIRMTIDQCNISSSKKKGTIRGLHYQLPPFEERKIVRCTQGAVFDVCADCRKDSPAFGTWYARELTAENHAMLMIPEGCAHGFQALTNDAEIFYMVSAPYSREMERGIRYDDPTLAIAWPMALSEISEKDAGLPYLKK